MYKSVFLEERISVNPSDITKREVAHDVDSLIVERLRKKIESRCISSGYVKPQSLELLHRSMGTAENGRFTGNYIFYVKLRCKVFHPETDTPIECKVIKVNKMGAYAVFDEAMRVLLPRDLHIGNVEFDGLSPDDTITLHILRSRFQTNDPFISAVGMFISRSKKGKAPVAEKAKVPEPEAEEQEGEIFEQVVEAAPVPVAAAKAKAPRGKAAKAVAAAPVAAAPVAAAPVAVAAPIVVEESAVPVTPAPAVAKRGRKRLVVSDEAPVAEAPVVVAPPPAPVATRRRTAAVPAPVAAAPVAAAPVAAAAAAPVATRTRRAAAV